MVVEEGSMLAGFGIQGHGGSLPSRRRVAPYSAAPLVRLPLRTVAQSRPALASPALRFPARALATPARYGSSYAGTGDQSAHQCRMWNRTALRRESPVQWRLASLSHLALATSRRRNAHRARLGCRPEAASGCASPRHLVRRISF